MSLSLAPGTVVMLLVGTLHDGSLLSGPGFYLPLGWPAVPLLVFGWHRLWRPALPPPASGARRALTWAAAGLFAGAVAADVAAGAVLLLGHTAGVDWSNVVLPVIYSWAWWPLLRTVTRGLRAGASGGGGDAVAAHGRARVPVHAGHRKAGREG